MSKKNPFVPQVRNPNKHNSFGLRLLEESIQKDGWIGAQSAAADGEIIAGSARREISAEKFTDVDGNEVEPIVVHSDGSRPVIIVRDDIPTADHPRARRLSVAENAIASANYNPDGALLAEWAGEDKAIRAMFSDSDWAEVTGEETEQGNDYSTKIEAPVYEIKGEKPLIEDLFDIEKTDELLNQIETADIPEDVKGFLNIAATRHTVFDFSKIAEYYAHSTPEIQRLMENSALVIIDFDRAIELGYVKLSEEIKKQFASEYPNG